MRPLNNATIAIPLSANFGGGLRERFLGGCGIVRSNAKKNVKSAAQSLI